MENKKDCKVAQGLICSSNTQEYWSNMNNNNESFLILIHCVCLKNSYSACDTVKEENYHNFNIQNKNVR